MMNIFRHFKLTDGQGIMYQNIRAVQDKYLSPPNIKKVTELINSLITNEYITSSKKSSSDWFFLTKKGEDYLYSSKNDISTNPSNCKNIIINNPINVNIEGSNINQSNIETPSSKKVEIENDIISTTSTKNDNGQSWIEKNKTFAWIVGTFLTIASIIVTIFSLNKSNETKLIDTNIVDTKSDSVKLKSPLKKDSTIESTENQTKESKKKETLKSDNNVSFTQPSINQGFVKLVSFDSLNNEWFGFSFISTGKLSLESIHNLKGSLQFIDGTILFNDKPSTALSELNYDLAKVEIIKGKKQLILLSKVFEIKQDNVTQFWCQVRK